MKPSISVVLSSELKLSTHDKSDYRTELQTNSVKMDCIQTYDHPKLYLADAKCIKSAVCRSTIDQSSLGNFSTGSPVLKTDAVKISCQSSELAALFPPAAILNTSVVFPSAVEQSTQNDSLIENKHQTDAVKTDCSQASQLSTSSEDSSPCVLDSDSVLKSIHLPSVETEFTSYKILPMETGVKSTDNKVATFYVKFDDCQSIDWMVRVFSKSLFIDQLGSWVRYGIINRIFLTLKSIK